VHPARVHSTAEGGVGIFLVPWSVPWKGCRMYIIGWEGGRGKTVHPSLTCSRTDLGTKTKRASGQKRMSEDSIMSSLEPEDNWNVNSYEWVTFDERKFF
jgi:hypothetical protein